MSNEGSQTEGDRGDPLMAQVLSVGRINPRGCPNEWMVILGLMMVEPEDKVEAAFIANQVADRFLADPWGYLDASGIEFDENGPKPGDGFRMAVAYTPDLD